MRLSCHAEALQPDSALYFLLEASRVEEILASERDGVTHTTESPIHPLQRIHNGMRQGANPKGWSKKQEVLTLD